MAPPDRVEAKAPQGTDDEGGKLVVPVAGIDPQDLMDTFTQSRGGGSRIHRAIDIPAPLGTPVLAASAGTIEKLFLSDEGGKTIYIRSPSRRRIYYYAHLDRYAPGISGGQIIRRGQPIGAVGHSGNADPGAPHLHFEIMVTAPDGKWHEGGSALNPYPLLVR
jgi:murein DD-endopeptidase MepM/ murein hydrolase activator NlpD